MINNHEEPYIEFSSFLLGKIFIWILMEKKMENVNF